MRESERMKINDIMVKPMRKIIAEEWLFLNRMYDKGEFTYLKGIEEINED